MTIEEKKQRIRDIAEDNYEDILDVAEEMDMEPYAAIDEYIKEFQSVVMKDF